MKFRLYKRKTVGEKILYTVVFIFFALFAFSYVYMIFWCGYSGMRTDRALAKDPFGFSAVRLKNYIDVFSLMESGGTSFGMMFLNSLYFSFLGPALGIMVTSMLAYVTNKYRFPGSGAIYIIVLVVITLPVYGSQSAMYKLLYSLGILNTRLMILTSLNGFSIYYMYFYAFYSGMSWSYAEAAQIDGANDWQIYFRVMFPQALTMVGSLFLLLWITDWNNYGTALLYLSKLPTLAVGIYQFKQRMIYGSRLDILYAGCTISLLPPLVMFIICNNALMSNVSLGGIKE